MFLLSFSVKIIKNFGFGALQIIFGLDSEEDALYLTIICLKSKKNYNA